MSLIAPAARFFFFKDPAPTEIYPLPLPAALPIPDGGGHRQRGRRRHRPAGTRPATHDRTPPVRNRRVVIRPGRRRPRSTTRSEEHTSELQSPDHLLCRLLLQKKKKQTSSTTTPLP